MAHSASQRADLAVRAAAFLSSNLVWDNHACLPLRPDDHSFLPQLQRMRDAHVDIVSINIGFGPIPLEQHFRVLAHFRRWLEARPGDYLVIRNAADIDMVRRDRKLGVVFDIEGLAPFDDGDHGLISTFYELGVRWAQIAYNRNNNSGGGCMDDDAGLTVFGREMIKEMQRVGMVVCCSHTGHATARDVLAFADGPVIFSHSNASALYENARNIPDDLIKACAETGGVVGVNGIGAFHDDSIALSESIVSHIDHIVQLAGPDHVGLGLDYVFDQQELKDYLTKMRDTFPDEDAFKKPLRLAPPEAVIEIASGLFARGYDIQSMKKIFGGNWRRIAETVWR